MPTDTQYDVIIVGAGIAGAIAAYKLAQSGKKVLVLEGGAEPDPDRADFMDRFYLSMAKTPESPYPNDPDNPRPLTLDIINWNKPGYNGYFIQNGPIPFGSTYERVAGGTTWHWMGTSLRLLPNDFALLSNYGHGVDWPIGYSDLEPYYALAEEEIGVAANVEQQEYLGLTFGDDPLKPGQPYEYPMPGIPQTVLDDTMSGDVAGMTFDGNPVTVTPTPQARNSAPYDGRRVCAGNTNCIPICPIQAKYDATIHIGKAQDFGAEVWYKTIAASVTVDPATGLISGINYKQYQTPSGPVSATGTVTAKLYVLAAHAIETPKLLLNSATNELPNGVANRSLQVGCNLMDHPVQLSWALSPAGKPVYPFRGPLSTSGVESLRDGAFRSQRAAFRMEIGNEGWNWANGDPYTTVNQLVTPGTNVVPGLVPPVNGGMFGPALVQQVGSIITRQFRFGSLVEQLPLATNRIVPSKTQVDNLGIPRPVINYDIDPYCRAGFGRAADAATQIFARMGATNFTTFNAQNDIPLECPNGTFAVYGAGHTMGTFRMGNDPNTSVVNANQQSHDHPNLFLLGSGVFPTVGTANPTLTIAALTIMAAKAMAAYLG
jgi:choline dehydrogenase-like flavoprotein